MFDPVTFLKFRQNLLTPTNVSASLSSGEIPPQARISIPKGVQISFGPHIDVAGG